MNVKAVISVLSIAGHNRWFINERAKASLNAEYSALRRVSVWP
jgi:hypothetical protein